MMHPIVTVPFSTLDSFLFTRGFALQEERTDRTELESFRVRVWTRRTSHPLLWVSVSQELRDVSHALSVNLHGTVSGNRTWLLHKARLIHSYGSVDQILERVSNRVAEATLAAETYDGTCSHCGSPTFEDTRRCIVRLCREAQQVASSAA